MKWWNQLEGWRTGPRKNHIHLMFQQNNHILPAQKLIAKAIKGGNFKLNFWMRHTTENRQNSTNEMLTKL